METYEEAKDWLHQLTKFGVRPGLDRVRMMMEALGNPERNLKSIHVGGTNGKGSTVAFLREPLKEAGIVCGTFTSPYVVEFRERIAVNGEPISEADFLKSAKAVQPIAEEVAESSFGAPTEFEVLTVIAAHYFAWTAQPDIVIWEVGLGGRLDSTNVIAPMISVITNVGHDHQHILGETLAEIAAEKAGIIKSGVPLVTCETNPEILEIFAAAVQRGRTKMYRWQHEFSVTDEEAAANGWSFSFQCSLKGMEHMEIAMLGRHQMKNAAAALMVLRYLMMYYALPLEEKQIRRGLQKASWPGRLDYRETEPPLLLDGAHNKEGMESLAEALQDHFPDRRLHLIISMTKEKNPEKVMAPLTGLNIASCTAVTFDFERAATAEGIAAKSPLAGTTALPDWKAAWEKIQAGAGTNDLVVFAGSLYFISEIAAQCDIS